MENLQAAIKTAFASEFAFYLKAHNFHWNVEGDDFQQMHDLFGDIYEEVYGTIDDFAENIRKTGAYAPGSLARFSILSEIPGEDQQLDCLEMAKELLQDSDKMAELFKLVYKMAEEAGEYGLANYFADRQDAHRKHSWKLRATTKPEPAEPGEMS